MFGFFVAEQYSIIRTYHHMFTPFTVDALFIVIKMCACVLSHFSQWLTLCDLTDSRLPGSSVHGTLQARILEWAVVLSSRGSSRPRDQTCVSYVYLHWPASSLPLVPPGKPVIKMHCFQFGGCCNKASGNIFTDIYFISLG